nr:hypothetical protein [Tanacetum cinerariifolium]
MATMIKQQVTLDEALVLSAQRFKTDTRKNIVDLEAFREMLHISPRVPGQSFAELPFEEEILEFLRTMATTIKQQVALDEVLVLSAQRFKMDTRKNIVDLEAFREMLHISPRVPGQSFAELPFEEEILEFLRDDILFSTIKVVSRHQNTQQYGAILPIELTTEDIRNTKAYKEYYACATGEAAPKPKASARRKRARATSPTDPSEVERTEAEQLKIVLRRSRQEMHISQQGGSNTDEGTSSKLGGRDDNEGKKTDESDADDDDQDEAEKDNADDDDEEEISKIDEQEATKSEESFDPIPRTPKDSEDDGNGEEDQGLRISEEERIHEEEEADELYRDVNINQGRGLQVSQDIEDSHVTLTSVHSDGQQESSSTSSFVTSLLNPIIDPGMESIFMTASSSVAPLPSPTSIMTPSIITTTTTASQLPIPPTPIPSEVLQNLLTFESVFHFEDRVKSLDVNFLEFMRTNQSPEAVSNISDEQQNLYKALVEAYEADKTILDSYGESAILKRRREDDDDQEGPFAGSDRGSKRRREGGEHASASTPSELATRSAGMSNTGTQSRQLSAKDQPIVQTSQHPEWFSQPRKPPTPDHDWNKTLPAIQGNPQSWISKLMLAPHSMNF